MNILYIGLEAGNWVVNIANALCEHGHTVTCFVQDYEKYDDSSSPELHKNLTVHEIPYEEILNPGRFKDKHIDKIPKDIDIVFTTDIYTTKISAYLGTQLKVPWTVMVIDVPTDILHADRTRRLLFQQFFEILKHCPAVFFILKVSRDEFYNFTGHMFPDDHVVPYAIPLPEKYYLSGVDIKGDYVISVCRLTSIKNCKIIPQALGTLDTIKKYVCVGTDKGALKEIEYHCKKNDIELIRYENISQEKKFELIRDSSMLIYPQITPYIGGLSPFEAMHVGKFAVIPKTKSMMEQCEEHAMYFTNNDAATLANTIAFCHSMKIGVTEEFKANAARFVSAKINLLRMGKSLSTLLETVHRRSKRKGIFKMD